MPGPIYRTRSVEERIMADRLNLLTSREVEILKGLGPHTRGHVLQLLAHHPELTLTSGRRTPRRNDQVGGSPRSLHLAGRAADFTGTIRTLTAASRSARRLRLGERCTGPEEVLWNVPGHYDHLHVAW